MEAHLGPRHPCPCCGLITFAEPPPGTYDICSVCGWEDDPVQFADPCYEGGANDISLVRAREDALRTLGEPRAVAHRLYATSEDAAQLLLDQLQPEVRVETERTYRGRHGWLVRITSEARDLSVVMAEQRQLLKLADETGVVYDSVSID